MSQALKRCEPRDLGLMSCRLADSQTRISKRAESEQIVSGSLPRKGVSLSINGAHMTCHVDTLSIVKYKGHLDHLCHTSWFSSMCLGQICPLQHLPLDI